MKVLFLDIDGVLNSEKYYQNGRTNLSYPLSEIDPASVDLINYIVSETGCKIVLSSSWRLNGLNECNNIFKKVGLPKIYDITPIHSVRGCRGEEIQEWLKTKQVESYVILDDDRDMLPEQQPHFINTYFVTGVTKENANQCIKILNNEI